MVAGLVLAVTLLFGGETEHRYRLLFETGGQLVEGNEVLVGGAPIGTVETLDLTDDGLAEVTISVDEPLHEGTTAMVRLTSLSGIANRYISVHPGPNNMPVLEDGATLETEETTSPVDLDQLFNALGPKARRDLQEVIEGSATIYAGNYEEARESYKYFAPSLRATQRFLAELTRDQRTFEEFLVTGSRILGAVAQRRDDLSALTENANLALGAIASENAALDRSLQALPPAMRQANTTFVNLRAALDDLDALVNTAKPATEDLDVFLRDLRPVAERAVPITRDLRRLVARPGPDNDLTDVLRDLPNVERRAAVASNAQIRAMNVTQDEVAFARPYTPDLISFLTRVGQVTAGYDGNGHYARVVPVTNVFEYDPQEGIEDSTPPAVGDLAPHYDEPEQQLEFFTTPTPVPPSLSPRFLAAGFERCPGGITQRNAGWTPAGPGNDHPFLDDGRLLDNCDPDHVPPPGATP